MKILTNKFLYLSAIALFAVMASGLYLLSNSTIVSAQKGDLSSRSDSKGKVARAEQLDVALRLGNAADFTVYGEKGVRQKGPANIEGRSSSGADLNRASLSGDNHDRDSLSSTDSGVKARGDLYKALRMIKQLPCQEMDSALTGGNFTPGVYCAPSAALAGQMVLDAAGDANSRFVFRIDGTLKSADNFQMNLENGAKAGNVYFVADTASIGAYSSISGSVIARGSVEVGAGTTVKGRAVSSEGEVILGSSANLALAPGYIQICKYALHDGVARNTGAGTTPGYYPQDNGTSDSDLVGGSDRDSLRFRIFRFSVNGGEAIQVPVGQCSQPILVNDATATVEELIDGYYTNLPQTTGNTWFNRFRLVHVSARTADGSAAPALTTTLDTRRTTFDVPTTGSTNPVILDFTNTFAIPAVIEICKYPVSPSGTGTVGIWGVQPSTGRIVRINPATGAILSSFAAPGVLNPADTLIGLSGAREDGTLLYVNSNQNASLVYRINALTGAVISVESLDGFTADGISYQRVGGINYIFSAHSGVDLHRQTGFSGGSSFFWETGAPVGALGGDGFGREFGYFSDGSIHEYSPSVDDGAFNSTLPAPSAGIQGLAFNGTNLYASSAAGSIYTLNPNTGAVTATATVAGGAIYGLGALEDPIINDTDVSGFFDFTVNAIPARTFTVPVGFCSGPIQVLATTNPQPTPGPSPAPGTTASAQIYVTELTEPGFTLENMTAFGGNGENRQTGYAFNTLIRNNLSSGCFVSNRPNFLGNCETGPNVGGGWQSGTVYEASTAADQTIFTFFNRTNPGVIKVCKIAGRGVPIGTEFEFIVRGRQATSQAIGGTRIAPGIDIERRVVVPAGPADQGGFCEIVSEESGANTLFIVGTLAYVRETAVLQDVARVEDGGFGDTTAGPDANDGVATDPDSEIRVSRITVNGSTAATNFPAGTVQGVTLGSGGVPNPDLFQYTPNVFAPDAGRQAIFRVNRGETVVTYVNRLFRPTQLKICKVAGTGIAVGTPFTFNITIDTEGGLVPGQTNEPITVAPITIPAGDPAQSAQGNCVVVDGPYERPGQEANPAIAPPLSFGTFDVGSAVTVAESGAASSVVITSPTGPAANLTVDAANRRATLIMGFAGGFNELIFVNSAAAPVSTGFSLAGRVMTPDGGGLRNAQVILTKADGTRMTVPTSSMGYYNFAGLANETYTVSVSSRRYRFQARSVDLNASLANVDFTGIE